MATCAALTVFEKNPFAVDMFNFVWHVLNHAQGQIPNNVESHFNQDIGFSVLYMQFIIRDSLRDILKKIHIRTTEDAIHVTRKLCRARRSNKGKRSVVFQVFLECCAIITEVYLYCCCGIQIPIESSMAFISWNLVFSRRRIRELLSCGGWEELRAYGVDKYHRNINFVNYQLESVDYPYENFITNQNYDQVTDMMAADFQENFADFIKHRVFIVQLHKSEKYRQSKAAMRMKRTEDRLIAKQKLGTASAELVLPSQNRIAMRSGRRPTHELVEWVIPYVTSDEDSDEDASTSVSELCTKMSNAQISGESKKKRPRRKRKPSHKATKTEEGSEGSSSTLIESESTEKGTTSETFTSSSRPLKLKVPSQSPEISTTKSEVKSPGQSKLEKK